MPVFPSREWAEEFCRALNESPSYRSSGQGWVWPILFKVRTRPGEPPGLFPREPGFVLELENGECKGVAWHDDARGVEAPFVISAGYRDWRDVIEGRVNPMMAILRRKLVVEKGDVSILLRYPKAALDMVAAAQRVGLD